MDDEQNEEEFPGKIQGAGCAVRVAVSPVFGCTQALSILNWKQTSA